IPRSIFIGLKGDFAPWVGALIADVKQPILLVTPEGKEEETVTRLSRVGFDATLGYLKGGFDSWLASGRETDSLISQTPEEINEILALKENQVFDVSKESEFEAEHLEDAVNTPLTLLNEYLSGFPTDKTFYVHCAGGYRSVIAASILKSRGIHNLIDIAGGFTAMKKSGMSTSDFVCPSTKQS
ncbi:MAG: MBL fold metallo-hydrolase, partial [Eudoraea sp.]|nr:MBL fold metallo-hydrolase [Eudoraea sp.]